MWANLDPFYVTTKNITAREVFYGPTGTFSESMLRLDELTKNVGSAFMSKQIKNIYQKTNFKGPVLVMVGENDKTHCLDNKNVPCRLLSASLSSVSSLVLLQLFSRIITFLLNQASVRLASPQTFGTAAIQFELLLSTILFICREGVRNALLRTHSAKQRGATSVDGVANISRLPLLLGVPISVLAAVLYIFASDSATSAQPLFRTSVTLYALAAIVELTSEPLYILAQNQLRFQVRVCAEGAAIISKTAVTFIMLVFGPPHWALLAFASGQAAYGLATLGSYLRVYGCANIFRLTHRRVTGGYFDREMLHLSAEMTLQSIVKHFLTEGDKFLVSYFSPLADQGGYALASNYGSLVARVVFQPIEETARVFFSKTLSSTTVNTKEAIETSAQVLYSLLLLFTHLLLFLITFGPPYLPLAVHLCPLILGSYIYYIPTMAFNGLLEAFLASTSTPADLRVQSSWMVVFSVGFIVTAVVLARGMGWGDVGLVWANILNLGARALYSGRKNGAMNTVTWRRSVPPLAVLSAFAVSAVVVRWSANAHPGSSINAQLQHVVYGVSCLAGCLSTCVIFERAIFREIISIMRRNK
ncbi:Rft-1-domain-containing protein [Hysterangium stoloniferum]|nr:Rft-1-domain-containing protein [Hysterangium stoloniferum]